MAHFAELNKDNIVLRVIVIDNDKTHDENGVEQETLGIAFCKSLFGENTKWVQTSYNGSMRNKYAATGDTYDAELDAFISAQPYSSWVLNPETLAYEAPVAIPPYREGYRTTWNEDKLQFDQLPIETPTPALEG